MEIIERFQNRYQALYPDLKNIINRFVFFKKLHKVQEQLISKTRFIRKFCNDYQVMTRFMIRDTRGRNEGHDEDIYAITEICRLRSLGCVGGTSKLDILWTVYSDKEECVVEDVRGWRLFEQFTALEISDMYYQRHDHHFSFARWDFLNH